jgi:hypothetical protein
MIAALLLLAAFSAAFTQVFRAAVGASRQGGDAATMNARFDAALAQLRRDAWGASRFEVTDPRTVRIERPGQLAVTWNVSEAGAFVRTLPDAAKSDLSADEQPEAPRREWPAVAAGLTFHAEGPVLSLVEPAGPQGDGRRVPLVSQLALAGAGAKGGAR